MGAAAGDATCTGRGVSVGLAGWRHRGRRLRTDRAGRRRGGGGFGGGLGAGAGAGAGSSRRSPIRRAIRSTGPSSFLAVSFRAGSLASRAGSLASLPNENRLPNRLPDLAAGFACCGRRGCRPHLRAAVRGMPLLPGDLDGSAGHNGSVLEFRNARRPNGRRNGPGRLRGERERRPARRRPGCA